MDLTNDVKELLRKAQHNEYEEHDPVYKTFGDVAQQEGFSAVAASFHKIAEIERAHGNRFGRLADLLEQGKLFVSDVQCAWMCLTAVISLRGRQPPRSALCASTTRAFSCGGDGTLRGRGAEKVNQAPEGGEAGKAASPPSCSRI